MQSESRSRSPRRAAQKSAIGLLRTLVPECEKSFRAGILLARARAKVSPTERACFNLRRAMQEMSQSGASRGLQLSALIADLWWRVDLMNADILEEEGRAGVFDVRHPAYPIVAQNLRARREKLLSTINVLERRACSTQRSA